MKCKNSQQLQYYCLLGLLIKLGYQVSLRGTKKDDDYMFDVVSLHKTQANVWQTILTVDQVERSTGCGNRVLSCSRLRRLIKRKIIGELRQAGVQIKITNPIKQSKGKQMVSVILMTNDAGEAVIWEEADILSFGEKVYKTIVETYIREEKSFQSDIYYMGIKRAAIITLKVGNFSAKLMDS